MRWSPTSSRTSEASEEGDGDGMFDTDGRDVEVVRADDGVETKPEWMKYCELCDVEVVRASESACVRAFEEHVREFHPEWLAYVNGAAGETSEQEEELDEREFARADERGKSNESGT